MPDSSLPVLDVERAVAERYSAASQQVEAALCCPVTYDPKLLKILPEEILERDYGCGDPSRHLAPGETVLDLGAGGGKICYIASQIVGPQGRVIGVDMNDDMLALARRWQEEMGRRIGWQNVAFRKGRIQDLALDLDQLDERLRGRPIASAADWLDAQRMADQMRRQAPMIPSDSIDVVISNCVLNLVDRRERRQLFGEVFRVLRGGGRAVISDITCDRPAPERLQNDPRLWSGCISGAFVESEFLQVFEEAGFYGVEILARQDEPWTVVEGIEFRSMTVRAYKEREAPPSAGQREIVYRGPWKSVADDHGLVLRRGERATVDARSYARLAAAPFAADLIPLSPDDRAAQVELPVASCCPPGNCC